MIIDKCLIVCNLSSKILLILYSNMKIAVAADQNATKQALRSLVAQCSGVAVHFEKRAKNSKKNSENSEY